MPKAIIGLVGPIASGKEVVKKYLENNYNSYSFKISTILRDVLNRLYLPVSRENMQALSTDLRQRFGNDILAKIISNDALNNDKDLVIIDGIRRLDDIVYLKKLPQFRLISIDAKEDIRHKRVQERNENKGDAEKSFQQFLFDNSQEAEKDIPNVMKIANYHLDNNNDLANLYQQIKMVISEII